VSIVVPARNEEDDIDACLDSLRACDYPDDKLEIIVVDDFSTDGTAERVRRRQPAGMPAEEDPVRLVKMAAEQPENGNHKPAAVATGVDVASGDVILTTDADCTVPPTWIQSMVRRCTPETPFVAGPVAYEHEDLFLPRLQALELMGLIGYGAGTLGVGLPTFCNSANVAYRREAIDALNAAPNGAAQDELLLQHVAYDTDRDVTFNPDPDALITTAPAASFSSYLEQQARWAHMGLRYPFVLPKLMVVGLWAAHVALFLACAAAVALPSWREPAILVFLGKMGADALLAVPPAKHFGQRGLLRSAVPTELLLLIAVPLVGILGTFGPLEWKGRELE
jgi:cellulose synthase/poly-beta-1,6-N-acetylglucosamine synthase-like glycosyltransferase